MSLIRLITSSILALALLAGCGKKGPLYHPGQNQAPEAPAAQEQAPEPADPSTDD